MIRSIEQTDAVKIVIFDLDDTLWRGVAAEKDTVQAAEMTEGWPLSIVEAASYLKKRGVLIAIVSKNDEKTALKLWEELYGSCFSIKNFVATRINWDPKPINVGRILKAVNLLPSSALFVDDNPTERAAVKAAFPDIRVMDEPLAHWRRILLWAPELQRAVITTEASQRAEMIHAQIQRDEAREAVSREDFLRDLSVVIEPKEIESSDDPRYTRCFELLNKTNQFNTTGRRWTAAEIEAFLASGKLLAFEVEDKYTKYGLTALMLISGDTIEQFVMSCRIFGLDVERACLAIACETVAASGVKTIKGRIKPSAKNLLSLAIYRQEGFAETGDGLWTKSADRIGGVPAHISVTSQLAKA